MIYTQELLEEHADIPPELKDIEPEQWRLEDDKQRQCIEWLNSDVSTCILAGENGVGKTWTGVLLLRAAFLNHKQTVRYAFAPSLSTKWLDMMRTGTSMELTNRLLAPKLLLLDDLGQRALSDGFHDFLLTVVDERINRGKRIIVTTNQNIEGFRHSVGPALTSRLSNGTAIKFTGSDRRVHPQ